MISIQAKDTAWSGIFPAMLTPLNLDEGLEEDACVRLIHDLLEQRLHGLYLTGNSGEGYALDDAVRVAVYRVTDRTRSRSNLKGRVIAHVGGVPTRRAAALARAAADTGCDAISALPPAGGRYTLDEITDYYRKLAVATPLPLVVYHIPERNGYDCDREQLSRWLDLPNVLGVKFTDHDFFLLERLISLHPDKAIFSGPDEMLMHAINIGATGAIGTSYNLLGPLALRIHDAARSGDGDTALRGQQALNAFVETLHATGGLRTFKTLAARRLRWSTPLSPAPAQPIDPQAVDMLENSLESALGAADELQRTPPPTARNPAVVASDVNSGH